MTTAKKRGTGSTMIFPKTLKVGCYDWKILMVDDLRGEDNEKLYGQCDPSHLVLRINGHMENQQIIAETLWHEILHAIWSHFHLEEKVDEEQAVACLSTGIVMVMRDNPDLKKYFWEIWK